MSTYRHKLLLTLLKILDASILTFSFFIAASFVNFKYGHFTLFEFLLLRIKIINVIIFLFMLFVWYLVFQNFQLYQSRRMENKSQEWKAILAASSFGIMIFIITGVVLSISAFSPAFILVLWLSVTSCTIFFRAFLRACIKRIRLSGKNLRHILIVGTNKRSYDFAEKIKQHKEKGYKVIGYVDKCVHAPNKSISLLGTLNNLPEVLRNRVVDEVVITLPIKSCYEEINTIIEESQKQGLVVRYLSSFYVDSEVHKLQVDSFEGFTILTILPKLLDNWHYLLKRVTDIFLVLLSLPVSLLIVIGAGIAIKLTDHGSIFFTQERVGYNKRIFKLYKLRTMVEDAEKQQKNLEARNEMNGAAFKIEKDPRITVIGKWLRKTSIDELPQLMNVLKGDMSLVGPRPLPLRDYKKFDKDWQRRRLSVLPGITCLWQVQGRNSVSFESWMEMDMEYINNWSFFYDLKIIVKTIPAVLQGRGAT